MVSIHSVATELKDEAINLFKYGYKEAGSLAAIFYNLDDLNKDYIDWKNIKPKMAKVKQKILIDGGNNGQVTWQEIDLKDQVMSINTVPDATHVTLDLVGPISFKRGEKLINVTDQNIMIITSDASTAVAGATTLNIEVDASAGCAASETIRLGGYSKPYGANEGNTFDADQYSELYNLFQRVNMTLDFDQAELNTMKIMFPDIPSYLKYKLSEAARRMLRGIIRDFYMGERGTTSIGGNTAYHAGGLDYFIRNLSGLTGVNYGTGSGAGTGEININGADTASKRRAMLDAIELIYRSGLSNIRGGNNLIFFCTTSFMREIEELFYEKLTMFNSLKNIGLNVTTINFVGGPISFMVDNVLDDLQTLYSGSIRKVCYSIPTQYLSLNLLANDVKTSDGKTTTALGFGKIFQVPQTAEEKNSMRLYTAFSPAFGAIKSGAYRKLNLQW